MDIYLYLLLQSESRSKYSFSIKLSMHFLICPTSTEHLPCTCFITSVISTLCSKVLLDFITRTIAASKRHLRESWKVSKDWLLSIFSSSFDRIIGIFTFLCFEQFSITLKLSVGNISLL